MKKSRFEYRRELAIAFRCLTWLQDHGFLDGEEFMVPYRKLGKFQDENKITITEKQLLSVSIIYKGK